MRNIGFPERKRKKHKQVSESLLQRFFISGIPNEFLPYIIRKRRQKLYPKHPIYKGFTLSLSMRNLFYRSRNMKKIIIAACMALLGCGSVFAQQGKQAIGGNLSYGTEIESVGIGLKYQYNITDQIRIEPSMNYFFKNDGLSMFDINANIHYLFPIASNISLYPLAGFTYTNWHLDLGKAGDYDVSGSDGKFGVNLGAGMEFDLDKNWSLNFDIKYQLISDLDQAVFNLGVAYNF